MHAYICKWRKNVFQYYSVKNGFTNNDSSRPQHYTRLINIKILVLEEKPSKRKEDTQKISGFLVSGPGTPCP